MSLRPSQCNTVGHFGDTNRRHTKGQATKMLVDIGEKIHVIERRSFESDIRRHFFGEVDRVAEHAARVIGYAFIFDSGTNTYTRSNGPRHRIVPLAAPGYVINVVASDTAVEDVRYEDRAGRLVVTDGKDLALDINEFGRAR